MIAGRCLARAVIILLPATPIALRSISMMSLLINLLELILLGILALTSSGIPDWM